jgi:uncharacterized membrane protein YdjX (TVP38/TMEM64 family)
MTRFLEILVEVLSWLKIVASPFILGLLLGGLFYLYKPDMAGAIIGGLIALTGLVIGIVLATAISKKVGATEFNSRIMATPDFDEYNKQASEEKNGN